MKKQAVGVSVLSVLFTLLFAGQAQAVNPISVGDGPFSALANPTDHEIYTANQWSDNVSIIDSVSDVVSGTVSVAAPGKIAAPVALAHNPNTSRLYVVNFWSGKLSVIRLDSRQVEISLTVGYSHAPPRSVVVNPATDLVYVTNLGQSRVYVIDGDTGSPTFNQILTTIQVGSYPRSAAVNTTLNRLYVANHDNNSVSVIDIDPLSVNYNKVIATVGTGSGPYAIGVNHSTAKVYAANRLGNTVSVIDGITNTLIKTVSAGTYPRALDINPERNLIYVANRDSNNVTVIDGSTDDVTRTVSAGVAPIAVACIQTPTGNTYVANYGTGTTSTVTRIDASFATTETSVGVYPRSLSIDALLAKPKVFVANYGSDNVSVIDPPALGSSLVTAIDRLPGDVAPSDAPTITGVSMSLATPLPRKIMKVYFQLDSMESTWTEALIAQGAGTSSVRWEAKAPGPLALGAHTVYAVALDMTGATVTSSDGYASSTPYTGEVASYGFTVGAVTTDEPRGLGFWKNWRNHYGAGEMEILLAQVKASSGLFTGLRVADIRGFLSFGKGTTPRRRAEAQLLCAWLNVASGRLGLGTRVNLASVNGWQKVVGPGGGPITSVGALLPKVGDLFRSGSPDKKTCEIAKNILEKLNEGLLFL